MRKLAVVASCLLIVPVTAVTRAVAEDLRPATIASLTPAALVGDQASAAAVPPSAPVVAPYQTLTVVLGGDLGLNPSNQPVMADGVVRHGQRYAFGQLTKGLDGFLTGDVVFANLETVVTDRNDHVAVDKAFNFRTHPAAVRHLVDAGFNVLSAANNHAFDYGEAGLAATARHLAALKPHGLLAAPGVGFGRAAATAPAEVILAPGRVGIGAVGIGGGSGFSGERATMASYHGSDFVETVRRLGEAAVDVRMLSVHFGQEMSVRPAPHEVTRLQDAALAGNIDIIAGHHAHVASGVQMIDGRLIFFGLGNLMHPGMRDMGPYGVCRDFGVLAKVHLGRQAGAAGFVVRAVEVWSLADMHGAVRVRGGDEGRTRVGVLNYHAAGLDERDGRARGLRFTPQANGSGLACTARAGDQSDDLAARCQGFGPTPEPAVNVAAACGARDLVARRDPGQSPVVISARHTAAQSSTVARSTWRVPPDDR